MKDCISVIIPVYNVEKYLARCVDSVLMQTYTNLEVILVDDGSTDGSGKLCDEYKEKDARIKVIHKENGGLSDARNAGLDIAKGDYIAFIDSDDFVTRFYIENLYYGICKTGAEMAMSGFLSWYENDSIPIANQATDIDVERLSTIQAMEKVLYQDFVDVCAWAKIYRKTLFCGIRYPKGKLYEDVPTTWAVMKKCNHVAVVHTFDYVYYQRNDSIQRMKFNTKKFDAIRHWKDVKKDVEENYPDLKKACCCRYLSGVLNILFQIPLDEYVNEQRVLWIQIKKIRGTVVLDRKARKKARLAAMISIFGKKVTQKVYDFLLIKSESRDNV